MNAFQRLMFRRSLAYKQCFLDGDGNLTPAAKIVLADLNKFAAVGSPTVISPVSRQTDVPATMQRVGRADVVSRVLRFIRVPISNLIDMSEAEND